MVATAFAAASVLLTGAAGATIVRELSGTPGRRHRRAGSWFRARRRSTRAADIEQKVRDTAGRRGGAVDAGTPGVPAGCPRDARSGAPSPWPTDRGPFPVGPEAPDGSGEAAISEAAARRTDEGSDTGPVGPAGQAQNLVGPEWSPRGTAASTVCCCLRGHPTHRDRPEPARVLPAAGVSAADLRGACPRRSAGRAGARAGDVRSEELSKAFGGGLPALRRVAVFGRRGGRRHDHHVLCVRHRRHPPATQCAAAARGGRHARPGTAGAAGQRRDDRGVRRGARARRRAGPGPAGPAGDPQRTRGGPAQPGPDLAPRAELPRRRAGDHAAGRGRSGGADQRAAAGRGDRAGGRVPPGSGAGPAGVRRRRTRAARSPRAG